MRDIAPARHSQDEAIDRAKFDLEYLKAHEVKLDQVPKGLQGWLFKPDDSPVWPGR